MRIVVLIDDRDVIERILRHLGLWLAFRSFSEGGEQGVRVWPPFLTPRKHSASVFIMKLLLEAGPRGRVPALPEKRFLSGGEEA